MISYSDLFYVTPACVKRLGHETFLKLPLFQRHSPIEPIYINEILFQGIFKHKTSSWEERSFFIKRLFSLTLDENKSVGPPCGFAYVDRQAEDIYQTSLAGNLGSGRAYYTGAYFNIKGEKTPLAISSSPTHSNGVLSTEDGLWSAFIGNALFDELSIQPSPVLAILRIDNSTCQIIRIDRDGSLDRITHLLYQPKALSPGKFIKTARALARLEADKFILRILHGAWSAGNASFAGHLIDYDTVTAVKGRQPQYSLTPKYLDNYFGFEHEGQLMIMEGLVNDIRLNTQKISFSKVKQHFLMEFKQHLAKGLLYLMGFKHVNLLTKRYADELSTLIDLFYDLSHYTYYSSEDSLYTNYSASLFFHIFDFSIFFRLYPQLKAHNIFSQEDSLKLLMASDLQKNLRFSEQEISCSQQILPVIKQKLDDYLLPLNCEPSIELQQKGLDFITRYDALYTIIAKNHPLYAKDSDLRAYVINEDRLYLCPVFSIEALLIEWQLYHPPKTTHLFVTRLIQANQRNPVKDKNGCYTSDVRLFSDGMSYIILPSNRCFQVVIEIDREAVSLLLDANDQWMIETRDQKVPASCEVTADLIKLVSDELPISQLIRFYSRDEVFLIPQCIFYHNNKRIQLTDFFYPNQNEGFYL